MATHLGYYNDPEDIRHLAGKTPEAIVRYFKRGNGAFHTADPGDGNVQGLRPVTIGKRKFYVRKSIDPKRLDSEGNFIDIYKV